MMTLFEKKLKPENIAELIDLTVQGDSDTHSMADLQIRGTAALYNVLCDGSFAYLADEVGMGKTYQALSLAAIVWNEKPDAKLLFLSPRENLQDKWKDDYLRFFASNYRRKHCIGDDSVSSVLFGEPVYRPELFPNLRSWTPSIGMQERIAPFIRHTSFTRPVYVTQNDCVDLDLLWTKTVNQLQEWGLFDVPRPYHLDRDNASWKLNIAFATALNKKLESVTPGEPYFDLVIIDEAQCLRNPNNQTNTVLFTALRGQVRKWLFMSATPAHNSPDDIPTILNHYLDAGIVLDPELVHDLPLMQQHLQKFMVRRQRQYRTVSGAALEFVKKTEYRNHDSHYWAVRSSDMTASGTLAMAIVQKGLVKILQGKNNRYQVGFLSSFESLQSSIRGRVETTGSDDSGDWYRDQASGPSKDSKDPEAPDSEFITRISGDYENRFGISLPHPKVDALVKKVAPQAFGSDEVPGGQKYLIFTRRVSTVAALKNALTREYVRAVKARMERCWGVSAGFDWTRQTPETEVLAGIDDPESFDAVEDDGNPFRAAMSAKGWLFNYRQTFRASGRNALFFEDGWLQRLCEAGGVKPEDAAENVSDEFWAESWNHASRSAGGDRTQQHRAVRVRYLAVQILMRSPEIFGLDESAAKPWRLAYEAALHAHLDRAIPASDPHQAPELFTIPTLWTEWDARTRAPELRLPAADPRQIRSDIDSVELNKRQVARSLLGQIFRLTDTLLDLYFADEDVKRDPQLLPARFLDWLLLDDPGSQQLRNDVVQWLRHLRLIVDVSLDGAGHPWSELAHEESWEQLFNLMAVVGVTGSSGGHRSATRQFRTPSLPRVIVCTDTLKEGVDMHLFCDQVLHYGVAWTPGDLEQRVGRVDRYFSQIERRLSSEGSPPSVQLTVGYPHVQMSLEQSQVIRVIERQRSAEQLMDSPLGGISSDERSFVAGAPAPLDRDTRFGPFDEHTFENPGKGLVRVTAEEAFTLKNHYTNWFGLMRRALQKKGYRISPDQHEPPRVADIYRDNDPSGRPGHQMEWAFDPILARYIITISDMGDTFGSAEGFSGGIRRRIVERSITDERYLRVLVPIPGEGLDTVPIDQMVQALAGKPPIVSADSPTFWSTALTRIGNGTLERISNHKFHLHVLRGSRKQGINIYVYENGVRAVSTVARVDELGTREAWGGEATQEGVREWALKETGKLSFGYLDVHERDGLVFGAHVIHGSLTQESRERFVLEVAWRADAWESRLTGNDEY